MMEMISIDKLIFSLQHEHAFTLRAEKDRMEHGTEGKAAPVTGAAQGLAQAGATVPAAPGVAGAAADFRVEQAESVALEVRIVGMAPDVGLVCAALEGAAAASKTLANNVGFTPDSRIAGTLKRDWNALNDHALSRAFPCAGAPNILARQGTYRLDFSHSASRESGAGEPIGGQSWHSGLFASDCTEAWRVWSYGQHCRAGHCRHDGRARYCCIANVSSKTPRLRSQSAAAAGRKTLPMRFCSAHRSRLFPHRKSPSLYRMTDLTMSGRSGQPPPARIQSEKA